MLGSDVVSVVENLIVNGTTTTINSTVTTIDDPIITLGGDTAPTTDDNKDRGVEFRWHNGTAAKVGFFGFDDSTGYLTFIPDATNTSEVFSGTQGDIQASNFRGNLIGNVTGNVSGSAGSVAILTAGSYLTGTSFNGSTAVTFAVDATSANTASKVVARDASGNFSAGTITAALSGNASTSSDSSLLNGISAINLYNNMGEIHGQRTSFDATTPSYGFGYRYVQGSTNGPGTGGTQFYSWYIGLGSQYPATGVGSHGAMFAVERNSTTPYLSVRFNESNAFGSWYKIRAGAADSWSTARTLTIGSTGKSVNGSADVAWTLGEIGASPTAGSASIITLGTVTTGTWTAGIIASNYGGTGVNNAGRTLTIGTNSGTITFTNATTTLTVANNGSISGTNTGDQTTISGNAGTATTWQTARTLTIGSTGKSVNGSADVAWTTAEIGINNGTLTLAVSGTGLSGSSSFTANQSGNTTFTVTSNATSANTASTIVARDGSGNFSAGTINAIAATGYLPVQLALVNNGSATVGSTRFSTQPDGAGGYISFNGAVTANSSGTIISGSSTVTGDHASRKVGLFQYTGGTTGTAGFQFFTADAGTNAILTERLRIQHDGNVGIGTTAPGYKLEVNGSFAATTKSFVIKHPTKEGKKLRYGSLEGPENGVYVRGKLKGSNVIELPDYWTKLIDPESITVQLTPVGSHQKLYVEKIEDNKVYIANENQRL